MPTKIEWATDSWNPITGCTPISEACTNCYAKRMARRLRGRCGYPADDPFKVTLHPHKLEEPLRWKKPRMVFVCSMGDLFHQDVPHSAIQEVLYRVRMAKWHTFLILTKRPERMRAFFMQYYVQGFIPNLWLGVTAENQKRADERIPILLQIPAAKHFVSVEPMLGPVDLNHLQPNREVEIDCLNGTHGVTRPHGGTNEKLDWVICGGETGPGARPMHPDWVRDLRDQCVRTGVPFFFKQWGEFAPSPDPEMGSEYWVTPDGNFGRWDYSDPSMPVAACMDKVGKKAAGYLIDGQEWRQFPNPYHWEEAET